MTLLEKYERYYEDKDVFSDERIVFEILKDLTDRRSFRQAFDSIDDDIKEEIIKTWIDIVNDNKI